MPATCLTASTRLGLFLALSACGPGPDSTTGTDGTDTETSSGASTTSEGITGTGAIEQPYAAELVYASMDSISGCSVDTNVALRIRVTAPDDQAIDTATLTSVKFTGWWSSGELAVTAEDLPVAAGTTAELTFRLALDGDVVGVSDCGSKELPSPPVVAAFTIAGEDLELTASGSLGCGFDEPPDSGC
ncbi:hypothetical protein OV079_26175 [Nannocystis pusilla]|uniref:Lipoprotein n=1 Tax=Nannocystis pusilla TaxID=889268 RepID=A0A9X3IXZ5_9BACT|nr:hypothetical protein [Nannocystis pusilla]MCY1008982.1 hypothetical protein [Nannocystis pusilla]